MRKGIPVSPGVSIGTAYCIHEIFIRPEKTRLAEDAVGEELARFESAKEQAVRDLKALEIKVYAQVGPSEAAVFAMHQSPQALCACGWLAAGLLRAALSARLSLAPFTAAPTFSLLAVDMLPGALGHGHGWAYST